MFNFNVTFKKGVPCNPSVFLNKKIDSVDMVVSKGKKNLKKMKSSRNCLQITYEAGNLKN